MGDSLSKIGFLEGEAAVAAAGIMAGPVFAVCASAAVFRDRITPKMAFYIGMTTTGAVAISVAGVQYEQSEQL